jgi:LmeA-like phospholipid-binding
VRKLIIVVLLVVTLAVAADFAAAAAAEHLVAAQLRQQAGLSHDPSVRINGFPFLTQALAGRYPTIEVQASGLSVQRLHDLDVEATLHDVEAPLSQVSAGNLQSVRVARVEGRVRITDSDLGRAIGVDDLRIQQPPSAAHPASGKYAPIQLVATTHFAGQHIEVVGIGVIELTGDLVRITINEVQPSRDGAGAVNLPPALRHTMLTTLSTDVKPGTLPFAVTPTRVWVQTGSVVVEGRATDVTLRAGGPGAG